MSHYKPYPAYKDSGVEWLEKVPEHWEVTPLKYEAEFVNGAAFKPEQWAETGTPIIRIENLNGSLSFNCFEGEMDFRYHVEKGDLLFGWSGNRGTSFGPFIWPHDGQYYLNQHIFRICNFKFDKRWFYWSLKAVTAHVEDQAHGIIGMVHITKGDLGSIKIATPALAEQQAIAVHLDRETARIDALITKKTRFIELLREKRQALITHAVTKGLDPNVKMKDSGVEWLGEVPEHWRVSKLKHNLREQLSYGANEVAEQDDPENPRFIRITDLNEDGTLRDETFKSLPMPIASPYLLSDGDVLLARSGATVGKSFLYKDSMGLACYAGYLIRARFDRRKVAPRYFWYITNSGYYWEFISGSNIQSTIQNVSGEKYGNLWIATPSLKEQEEIASKLDHESARFELLIRRTEKSIELLRERRSALITAAVTGQIDLREAA